MWNSHFKAIWRFHCLLPFSENFLSAFPLPKFSLYLVNFCQKKKVQQEKYPKKKPLKKYSNPNVCAKWRTATTNKSENKLSEQKKWFICLITEVLFPPNKSSKRCMSQNELKYISVQLQNQTHLWAINQAH